MKIRWHFCLVLFGFLLFIWPGLYKDQGFSTKDQRKVSKVHWTLTIWNICIFLKSVYITLIRTRLRKGQCIYFLSWSRTLLRSFVFGSKNPVFEAKTGVSEHSKFMEYSEFVLFQTFQKLRKNYVKIAFRKSQKNLFRLEFRLEHSSSSLECRALLIFWKWKLQTTTLV